MPSGIVPELLIFIALVVVVAAVFFVTRRKPPEEIAPPEWIPRQAGPTAQPPGEDPKAEAREDLINLNTASFEDLRAANLSVTQATRVLAYRERRGGYSSVSDLDPVPGFPEEILEELKQRVTV